jgi:hypothetical protein
MGEVRLGAMVFAMLLALGGLSGALAEHAGEIHELGAPENRPCAVEHATDNTDNPVVDEIMADCGESHGPPEGVEPGPPKGIEPGPPKKDIIISE